MHVTEAYSLQSLLNLRLHALTGAGHLAEGVTLLEREVCGRETGELGVPREAFPQLVEAVGDRGDAGTQVLRNSVGVPTF